MLFRLNNAQPADPAVTMWFAEKPVALASIAMPWFAAMKACGADVGELLADGCPVACVEDAPFGYVNVFTKHVNVGFFRGAFLSDPNGLLEGTGRQMRHVKLRPGEEVNEAALHTLVREAYRDIREKLAEE